MIVQILTQPATLPIFFVAEPEPICASARDYGFDFYEEELARELLAPLPASLTLQSMPAIEADEFDQAHCYFLS